MAAVENLAGSHDAITRIHEVPGQHPHAVGDIVRLPVVPVPVDAGGRWAQPRKQGRTRRVAQSGGRMSVGENDTALGEPFHVGRDGLGMSVQRTDPVVHVVDGDEQNIGRVNRLPVSECGNADRKHRQRQRAPKLDRGGSNHIEISSEFLLKHFARLQCLCPPA